MLPSGRHRGAVFVEALLVSIGVVALAEIGDKTQLLAFILAARFKRPFPIIAGICCATLVNHGLAGALGAAIFRSGANSHPVNRT